MKSVKQIAFAALLTMGAFGAVTLVSCSKDDDPVVCQTGYEGDDCKTLIATKFIGTYAVSETCSGTASTPYQVVITADPTDLSKLLISNLGNYGCTVGGTVTFSGSLSGSVKFTVNDTKCGYEMSATGTYSTNGTTETITIDNYSATYDDPNNPGTDITDVCSATMTKQN